MSVPAYVRYGHPISTRALDKYDLTSDYPSRDCTGILAGKKRRRPD